MRPPVNHIAEEKNRNVDVLPRQPPPALMLNDADLEVHSGRVDLLLPDRPGAENVILIHSVETGLFFFPFAAENSAKHEESGCTGNP